MKLWLGGVGRRVVAVEQVVLRHRVRSLPRGRARSFARRGGDGRGLGGRLGCRGRTTSRGRGPNPSGKDTGWRRLIRPAAQQSSTRYGHGKLGHLAHLLVAGRAHVDVLVVAKFSVDAQIRAHGEWRGLRRLGYRRRSCATNHSTKGQVQECIALSLAAAEVVANEKGVGDIGHSQSSMWVAVHLAQHITPASPRAKLEIGLARRTCSGHFLDKGSQ